MNCQICNDSVKSIAAYKLHHSIFHSSAAFLCLNQHCGRYYSSWRCFARHADSCSVSNVDIETCVDNDVSIENTSASPDIENNVSDYLSTGNFDGSRPEEFVKFMNSETDILVSKLYRKAKLPRQYVQDIISDVNTFIKQGLLPNLKKSLIACSNLDKDQIIAFEKVLSLYDNPFSHLSTEHLRFKYFEASGDYIPPISVKVGEVDISVKTANGPVLKTKECFVQSVPIPQVLKKFLETPGALDEIVSYMNSLDVESNCKENFIQCELWKTKRAKYAMTDIVLPLHTFYDDVEVNNALGSSTDKLGATYVSIPCLPPECQATVENIFLALVFESWMRDFGDEKVFASFISQLKSLEKDGIIVDTPKGQIRVFFVTGLLLGDNLGLNSISGFVECFTANFCCRLCKTHKSELITQSAEDLALIRTLQSYQQDLELDNATLTGIKKDCVFNQLESFHITSNPVVDVFHDLCEGVCHYVMLHVLKHCVPKFFTVSELNNRINMFQYGPCDSNRIPPVSEDFTNRHKLKMSGSETLLFVKLFGLLIGDKIPSDDLYWRLYLKLLELLDICMSKNLSSSTAVSLKVIVEEFNSMYVEITGDSLKAKMHMLNHYCSVFLKSGPFPGMSTKRYESKHRSLTIPAHATESRRNISRTVAIHHQLNLCHRFKSKVSILPETVFGPFVEISLDDFENDSFVKSLPDYVKSSSCLLSPNWIDLKGSRYKPGMVLLLSINNSGGPVFGVLECIIFVNDEIIFIFSYLTTLGLYEHVHAYEVEISHKWSTIKPEDLYDPLPLSLYHSSWGSKFVILRYVL